MGSINLSSKKPLVSIGLPVYNGEKYLRQTLDLILNQPFKDIEVVISDNASTDSTEQIFREYADRDPRLRYFRSPYNKGAAWNYNQVFRLSRGKYFKWAAADDLFHESYIQKCVAILENNPDYVLCFSKTLIINENGSPKLEYDDDLDLSQDDPASRFKQLMNLLGECNAIFGLIRSDVLRKTNLIGKYIASDVVLLAQLSIYGKFFEIPEFLFYRRDHPLASSANKSYSKQMEFFNPVRRYMFVLPRWRRYIEMFRVVVRSPLKWNRKIELEKYLVRRMIWNRDRLLHELLLAIKSMMFSLS